MCLTASPRAFFRESGFCLFISESDKEYNKYKNIVWCHCLHACYEVSNFTHRCFCSITENVNTVKKADDALVSRK